VLSGLPTWGSFVGEVKKAGKKARTAAARGRHKDLYCEGRYDKTGTLWNHSRPHQANEIKIYWSNGLANWEGTSGASSSPDVNFLWLSLSFQMENGNGRPHGRVFQMILTEPEFGNTVPNQGSFGWDCDQFTMTTKYVLVLPFV
jgi:hypothetical protein